MKNFQKGISIFFVLLGLMPLSVTGQDQNLCTQTLNKAIKTYEAGKLDAVPSMLESCLEDGFTRAEKLQALRLMVLTYLFQDNDPKAEEAFLKLLKEDPEYTVNEAIDPAEFIYLYRQYRTIPFLNIGLKAGLNTTFIYPAVPYELDNNYDSKSSYTALLGYQIGINADILIRNRFQLAAELLFSSKKYKYSNVLLEYSELTFTETQNWLELPVMLKYTMGSGKLRPYIQAGVSAGLLLTSSAGVNRVDATTKTNQAVGPDVDTKNLRMPYTYSAVFGLGLRYKVGYGYAVLDARYNAGLHNAVRTENRYANTDLVYKYGYISDNFLLNNLMFSLGYYKSLYKPKKIKNNVD